MTNTPEAIEKAWKEHLGRTALATDAVNMRESDYKAGYREGYRAANEWVPVSERLPEIGQRVLVPQNGSSVEVGWISNRFAKTEAGREPRWERFGRIWRGRVSHWMPLPTPPDTERLEG